MIHKFHKENNRWDGIEGQVYKNDPELFRNVTKYVLFDNDTDLPVQFRYFQVEKDGYTSLEHHAHRHVVVIFRGKGHILLGDTIRAVSEGDLITIDPWEWHQLRADEGELLGFFCLVKHDRDVPVYPTKEEREALEKAKEE